MSLGAIIERGMARVSPYAERLIVKQERHDTTADHRELPTLILAYALKNAPDDRAIAGRVRAMEAAMKGTSLLTFAKERGVTKQRASAMIGAAREFLKRHSYLPAQQKNRDRLRMDTDEEIYECIEKVRHAVDGDH